MNIKQENIDELNAKVTITIEPADYEPAVKSVLDDHRKKMTLQGFRPGKVPFGVAKKMYGKAVLAEELNRILSDKLNTHIRENDINIIGQPLPEDVEELQLDFNKTFEFNYELGIAPNFEVELTPKDKFNKYKIKVDDDLINKYVKDFQRRHGNSTESEVVADTDMIYGALHELAKDGKRKEGGLNNHTTIAMDYLDNKDAKKKLIGKKKGDTVKVEPAKLAKGDVDLSQMLGIPVSELAEVGKEFELVIESIDNIDLAPLNTELFDKVIGPGGASNEQEFRDKISADLEKYLDGDSEKKIRRDIHDKLIERLKLDLPDAFIKRWLLEQGSNNEERPISQADIDREYHEYSRMLKIQLIEGQIAKQNEIKVELNDIQDRVKENIKAQFASFGQGDVADDMLDQFAQNFLQKEEEVRKVYDQLMDERLNDFYKTNVKLQEKEVTFDEFVKLASNKAGKGKFMDQVSNLLKF
ncbi:MAG: trigger factor [Flavobacteriales bacterium]|nr:trigger factor [Flavobacteriales bacterium]